MVRIFGVLLLLLYSALFTLPAQAVTQAGTRIVNQAQATYFDTASGKTITILSDVAAIVVAPYLAHEQNQDTKQYASVGQPVYFPHTIINTGNVVDSYKLAVANMPGDNGDLNNLKIYLDSNGDGQANPGEPEITTTSELLPGQQIKIVVVGTVPDTSNNGDQYLVNVISTSVRDSTTRRLNIDTVTVGEGAVLRINHTVSVSCSTQLTLGQQVIHEASFTNIGNAPPNERLIVVDGVAIPGILIESKVSTYFNLVKQSEFAVAPVQSIRLVGVAGQTGWLSYDQWDGKTKVERIAILVPSTNIKPHQSGKFSYSLTVSSLPDVQTIIQDQSVMDQDGDTIADFQSNSSCNTVTPVAPPNPTTISGVVFDSVNLIPIAGATIELVTADGNKVITTTLSDTNGAYTFSNTETIPTGQYYLRITPPTGYTSPSIKPPSNFTTFHVENPSYGRNGFGANESSISGIFSFDSSTTKVAFDIPLDRQNAENAVQQIAIEKSVSKSTVAIGDLIEYTIKARNLSKEDLFAAYIQDQMPYGFKFLSGTAKLNGTLTNDPAIKPRDNDGVNLSFSLGKFAMGTEFTLTYLAQVTAAAVNSAGTNTAYAYANTVTSSPVQSPTAKAHVEIKQEGVLSDRAILFGRIATEANCKIGNDTKRQAAGWPLANVRLYLEDGTYVISDSEGQFSLYGLKPGLHVLKVDGHTLPVGVVLKAVDVEHAGDPDSRFVDLLSGDFHRADFVAACPEEQPERTETVCKEKLMDNTGTEWVTRTIPNSIEPLHFDSGKADIKPEYMEKLRQLVDLAKDKQNVRLKFIGHTDNQRLKPETKAKFKDNPGLSQYRAKEAAEFVVQNLGRTVDITTDGKGEDQPIASNASDEGMAQNRRVEIELIYDEPVEKYAETQHRDCTVKTIAGTGGNLVAQRIMARVKTSEQGWHNEVDFLDPGNLDSLSNLARQATAGKDGDISNGLMEAYQNKVKQHQEAFSTAQDKQQSTTDSPEPTMPLAKEAVKTITAAQGKEGAWLWPLNDTSLDGRFMIVVPAGTTPSLQVNGKVVTDSHLGEQIVNKRENVQLLAWYGVELVEGENQLKVASKDDFGNERVIAQKTFKRPAAATTVKMTVDGTLTADGGRSMVPIKVQVLDNNGYPAKGVYFLTLEASDGIWAEADIQDRVSGHQIKITNGERIVHLRSTSESGQIKVRASIGTLQSEADVTQVAEMRPLIAVGMIDLRVSKGFDKGYESVVMQELADNSDTNVDGRAAIFMKGRIKGDMHMTLAYDNKKKDTELLRDIDPQAYYEVYGDSSLRGYEAQSRSNLYLKLEKDRHSVMWGDYVTDSNASSADIAKVQRTLTGTNSIYDDGTNRVQVFAARQDNLRVIEELPGNGTALNFQVKGAPLVRNSEIVEVITRDKANSGLLIKTEKLERFRDYSIDDVTGRFTFYKVIPSVDDNLNPVFVRVSYDQTDATNSYIVSGLRAETKITDELKVGGSFTKDDHPTEGSKTLGVHAQYKNDTTAVDVGVARMEHNNDTPAGNAIRIQATQKWDNNGRTDITAAQAQAGYTNSGAGVQADRREIKVTHEQKVTPDITAKAEVVDSKSLSKEDQRRSAELSATTNIDGWKLKGGVRHIEQSDATKTEKANTALVGVEHNLDILGKKGSVKGEYEHEVGGDASRKRLMLGADMEVAEKTKAYIRYENADQLASGTLAGAVDTQKNLVAGVKTEILPSTEMYSEYRIQGDMSGQDVVAVNGGKATLDIDKNLEVTPSVEFMNYLKDSTKEDSIAASVGIKDTRDKNTKKLLRLETRRSKSEHYYGVNGSYVARLNDDITAMIGDQARYTDYKDGRASSIQNTLTIAAANRPKDGGPYNSLYTYKWKKDTQNNENTHIFSTHQNYRIGEDTEISGQLGAKRQKLTEGSTTRKSNVVLAAVHAQQDVTDKLGVDAHAGVMASGNKETSYLAGAGVNYNVMDNVRVGAGYNVSGVTDNDLDPNGAYRQGGYVGLQMKADEGTFGWLDGKKPECTPRYMVEREQMYQEGKTPTVTQLDCDTPVPVADENPAQATNTTDSSTATAIADDTATATTDTANQNAVANNNNNKGTTNEQATAK